MFPPITESEIATEWLHVNAEEALSLIVSSKNVQEATGLDRQALLRRLTAQWSAEAALKDCELQKSLSRIYNVICRSSPRTTQYTPTPDGEWISATQVITCPDGD